MSEYRRACAAVNHRSGGLCEANIAGTCPDGPHRAAHHHHIVLRARGGKDLPSNLLHVCNAAHLFIHANPAWSTEHGFIARKAIA